MEKGSVRVLTGNGKGKTTGALGMAIAEVSKGRKVFMVQFLKTPDSSGEHFAVKVLSPQFAIFPMGTPGFIKQRPVKPEEISAAGRALETARSAVQSGDYDLIILDEVNVAIDKKLLSLDELLAIVDTKPPKLDLLLTGRNADPKLVEKADTVWVMNKKKHYFDAGVKAKRGIDF
jgi:cob(I)alamin adenosyltransferase